MTKIIDSNESLQALTDKIKLALPDAKRCEVKIASFSNMCDCVAIHNRMRARFRKHRTLKGSNEFNVSIFLMMYHHLYFKDDLPEKVASDFHKILTDDEYASKRDSILSDDIKSNTMYLWSTEALLAGVNCNENWGKYPSVDDDEYMMSRCDYLGDDYVVNQDELDKDLTAILADHDSVNDDDDEQIRQDMLDDDLNEETIQYG